MNNDLAFALSEEIEDWNRIIFDVAKIPKTVFRKHGTISFSISLHSSMESFNQSVDKDDSEDFQKLCDSVPHIQRECINLMSMSYGGLMFLETNKNTVDDKTVLRSLMDFSTAKGAVLSMLPESAMLSAYQARQRQKQSAAHALNGSVGGKAKHRNTHELRAWVVANADQRLPATMDTAKKLVAKLPLHLVDKSNNPERFIYDVLRGQQKKVI